MNLNERITAFASLGVIVGESLLYRGDWQEMINAEIERQNLINPWFTSRNVRLSLTAIAENLRKENLLKWCSAYPGLNTPSEPWNVAVIMAGNIPLVGFHDFLSVLISGNRIIIKKSSKDPDLIVLISDILKRIKPEFENLIVFCDEKLTGFDSVIATGSDNSSRYFEYYFGKYPHIIRRNRNSISIIDGSESAAEIEGLGNDIFSYFGLGCRNVSKVYIPSGYDPMKMAADWGKWEDVAHHSKYANNYDYNKAVFLVNRKKFIDTGYLLITEDQALSSPVGVLHTEYYTDRATLENQLGNSVNRIQCITGKNHMPFGQAQYPELWDYADGTDTLEFLLKKNRPGIS